MWRTSTTIAGTVPQASSTTQVSTITGIAIPTYRNLQRRDLLGGLIHEYTQVA
jgi:hypothetical protein